MEEFESLLEESEAFTRYRSPASKDIQVTIQKDGTAITFNQVAYVTLGSPLGVLLRYHKIRNVIFIIPSDLRTSRGTRINRQGESKTYYIAGKAFTKTYDIDTSIARRYKATSQNGIIIVDLNGPSADATGPRSQTKPDKPQSPDPKQQLLPEVEENDKPEESTLRRRDENPVLIKDFEVFLQKYDLSIDSFVEYIRSLQKMP